MELSKGELTLLRYLREYHLENIPEDTVIIPGMSGREIASALSWLQSKGYVILDIKSEKEGWKYGPEGRRYLERGLPELRAIQVLKDGKEITLKEMSEILGPDDLRIALAQLAKFGIKPSSGKIHAPPEIQLVEEKLIKRQETLKSIESKTANIEEIENLSHREGLILPVVKNRRFVTLTEKGKSVDLNASADYIESVTSELIASSEFTGKSFRPYDLNAPSEKKFTAYYHPLSLLVRKIRSIFLKMGFTEMTGHYVEYSGWNMDALFIPQDHPARDLQDTFYLSSDRKPDFEHPEILKKIAETHENGIPGYTGWGYKFNEDEARRLLLRTHTTVSTIRYLYESPSPQTAVFSVEKVFRHESVDWKHLAELHQVEGAVHSKNSNLSSLKGMIRSFYSRLGFDEIEFIPSYYPYTEPSMDIIAIVNGREVELGGSGIFRPEVTKPLGLKYPVIAWGLGLERLAMLLYNLDDIRKIYNSDIDWLRTFNLMI